MAPWAGALGLLLLFAVALRFVDRAVLPYYLDFSAAQFAVYWPKRFALLGHISFGMIALLIGPFQLWAGLRGRYLRLHRWAGRVFIAACLLSAACAFYLALTPTFGWSYGVALIGLAAMWSGSTLVGYMAIRRGALALHRRWMIRAYAITFAFVAYRLFTDYLAWAGIGDVVTNNIAAAWFCWAFPLVATLLAEGASDLRKAGRQRARG